MLFAVAVMAVKEVLGEEVLKLPPSLSPLLFLPHVLYCWGNIKAVMNAGGYSAFTVFLAFE